MSSARHMYKNITCRALESQHIQWTIPHVVLSALSALTDLSDLSGQVRMKGNLILIILIQSMVLQLVKHPSPHLQTDLFEPT